jgi:hypothetical protein
MKPSQYFKQSDEFYFLKDGKINIGQHRVCDKCKGVCAVNACEVIECGNDWIRLFTGRVQTEYFSVEDYTDEYTALCEDCWEVIKETFMDDPLQQ